MASMLSTNGKKILQFYYLLHCRKWEILLLIKNCEFECSSSSGSFSTTIFLSAKHIVGVSARFLSATV